MKKSIDGEQVKCSLGKKHCPGGKCDERRCSNLMCGTRQVYPNIEIVTGKKKRLVGIPYEKFKKDEKKKKITILTKKEIINKRIKELNTNLNKALKKKENLETSIEEMKKSVETQNKKIAKIEESLKFYEI